MLADGTATRDNYSLFEVLLPLGSTDTLHVQSDEVFYVLDGELEFFLGDRKETGLGLRPPGHGAQLPGSQRHGPDAQPPHAQRLRAPHRDARRAAHTRSLPPWGWTAPVLPDVERRALLSNVGLHELDLAEWTGTGI